MNSTKQKLAEYEVIEEISTQDRNPIDVFLLDNEPAGIESSTLFREQLSRALNYEDEESKTDRNVVVVSSFMDHCKKQGLEIPDTLFESYFGCIEKYETDAFETAVAPAIRYLLNNHNPHTKIYIDYENAQLLAGEKSYSLRNEVPD